MILGKVKSYALLILSVLAGLLAFLLKMSSSRSKRLKTQSEHYKAQAEKAKEVVKKDIEISTDADERTKKAAEEIEREGHTDELSDPNNWD